MGYHGRNYSSYNVPDNRDIKKGDIYYIAADNEGYNGRPAVVVSSDKINNTVDTVCIVYLTNHGKETTIHVPIECKTPGYALCESVCVIKKDKIMDFIKICSDDEIERVDKALSIIFELPQTGKTQVITKEVVKEVPAQNDNSAELLRAQTERDIYKDLYTELLKKFTAL